MFWSVSKRKWAEAPKKLDQVVRGGRISAIVALLTDKTVEGPFGCMTLFPGYLFIFFEYPLNESQVWPDPSLLSSLCLSAPRWDCVA